MMSEAVRDRDDYLSLVSGAADRLARLGYIWQPSFGGEFRGYKEARLLAFTPVARRNGFQSLLYREAWAWGFAPIPVTNPFALSRLPWPGRMVCHFHWLGRITAQSIDEREAETRVRAFEELLQVLKKQGRQIVWTVHNVLPHNAKWPEQDLKIRKIITRHADVIHIMTAQTVDMLKDYYEIPINKVFLVPHPAYSGFYPDNVTRDEARARLDVPQDSHTFLTFGAIQRYKGYERLMEAFERMVLEGSKRKLFLIIAGDSSDTELSREIRAWALGRNDVLAVIKPIRNEDIQLYYRAADVAICPYNATLNSGAALLAITFGKPVIGPQLGGLVDNVGPTCAWLYDPLDRGSDSLLNAMNASSAIRALEAKSAAAIQRAHILTSEAPSNRFFAHLERTIWPREEGKRALLESVWQHNPSSVASAE